jgi:hypothetical protein
LAVYSSAGLRVEEAGTNRVELKQLIGLCLPGARLLPEPPARAQSLLCGSNDLLNLMTALRENPEPRKGAGYWSTPTMRYLSRQKITADSPERAVAVVKLLHALTRGTEFVNLNNYQAGAVEGGWVVEVVRISSSGKPSGRPPYELVTDESQRVTELRERCYDYPGSRGVYEETVRRVYEEEIKRNDAADYEEALKKELAREWQAEKGRQAKKAKASK